MLVQAVYDAMTGEIIANRGQITGTGDLDRSNGDNSKRFKPEHTHACALAITSANTYTHMQVG